MLAHVFDTRGRHDPRLGGEVNLGMRDGTPDGLHLCDVGHDKGVRTRRVGHARKVQRGCKFMLAQVNVACHVHARAMRMCEAHRARKLDGLDVFRARTGIEGAKSAVDGIGTRGNSRKERIDRARGGQQLW